jgi:hypothetical protein
MMSSLATKMQAIELGCKCVMSMCGGMLQLPNFLVLKKRKNQAYHSRGAWTHHSQEISNCVSEGMKPECWKTKLHEILENS